MMDLNPIEKLLIIAIACCVVIVVLILTICTVSSFCWIYQCIHGAPNGKKDAKGSRRKSKSSSTDENENTPLQVAVMKERLGNGTSNGNIGLARADDENGVTITSFGINHKTVRPTDSTYSSMSTCSHEDQQQPSTLSMHSEAPEIDETIDNGIMTSNYGQLTFTVCYTCAEGRNEGQLLICIVEAEDLPPREYNGACDPYFSISVMKLKGRRSKSRKSVPLFKFVTSTMRKTQHPIYKETFMSEISKNEIKDCSIKIKAFDDDKYANDTELAEIQISILELQVTVNEPAQIHTVDLNEPKADNGEILFGINYLPTAERLTFSINKAHNLKMSAITNFDNICPYVRVLLFHNGKLLKRKKTSSIKFDPNNSAMGSNISNLVSPIFDESIAFDVPQKELENVSFIVLICQRGVHSPESESDFSAAETANVGGYPSRLHDKTKYIGKVIMGHKCRQDTARQHWFAMLQSPRKQLSQWHTLH